MHLEPSEGSMGWRRSSSPTSLRLVRRPVVGVAREGELLHVRRRPGGVGRKPIRVVIAEGQALVRAGYRALLETDPDIEVVGEAATAEDALALTADISADVVLLDLGLPDIRDLEAAEQTISHSLFAEVAVILVAPAEHDERVYNAVRAGAIGVVAKNFDPDELTRAVHTAAEGNALLSARTMRRLLDDLPPRWPPGSPLPQELDELTDREREVVALVALGLTSAEIADRLVISPATAKTHISRAMFKLGAHHRAQLVVMAYESGLVQPRSSSIHRNRALTVA
jgi:DNA-binding NarL/FixJ family response regulator